ncbi:MAG: glycosyltransferase family 9 protein [Betaproteobacteria bacterium]|nr:glycosyltransferase family 9 protein [Betaproteobacteria bacterium]
MRNRMPGAPRFLVIRRDNIGDLVCTTPLLAGLRGHYPQAHIAALVNSYNCDVLAGNPDVDEIFAYTKAKHRQASETLIGVYAKRVRMFFEMRRGGFDVAILAAPGYQAHGLRFARLAGANSVLGFAQSGQDRRLDVPVPYGAGAGLHEVEDVWRLLAPLGVYGRPPAMKVQADPAALKVVEQSMEVAIGNRHDSSDPRNRAPVVALHLSARRPSQRWPVERYAALANRLHATHKAVFIVLWAPGSAANPLHPGDDEKRLALEALIKDMPALFYPTHSLGQLIAALSSSDIVICPDGGAMHLAAGLGKPLVCLFGDSPPSRWRPWGVAHELLQSPTHHVCDISAAEVENACTRLLANCMNS